MASSRKNFVHDPLDHTKPSIRLIELQPHLSEDGLAQCALSHATIDGEYTCLSYMWGPKSPTAVILVNGKEFRVRQNLFDFLKMATARKSFRRKVFWIDAVCIDQENRLERQHQVLQMGDIYAQAKEVIAWLGLCNVPIPLWALKVSGSRFHASERLEIYREGLDRYLYDNPYWNRAWITQEITLARKCSVILNSTWMALDHVIEFYLQVVELRCMAFNPQLKPIDRTDPRRTMPIITLLATFENRKCSIPQDRIFSLLSLCDERQAIVVDYKPPRLNLMLNVLNIFPDKLCICSVYIVGRALELTGTQCKKVHLKKLLWLSIDLDPRKRVPEKDHDLAPELCTSRIEVLSPRAGYADWYKGKIWVATFTLQDRLEHVIYWGAECTMNMPVYYARRRSDGTDSEYQVLCRYGDGLELSAMAADNGKYTLRVALPVFMKIVAAMKHELCDVAKFGRQYSYIRDMGWPEMRIGYHDC
ncbi:uncharacterized protein N0V89_001562 [Didymosphaeria variabile]|uniref:Heterokaryon incompatibility domain-containing protein n=1 Tax=Didymosphaeria variabile TaxID=1932322 RepID=A0A9W9CG10_9PLEO|nr:uncharacterized protein N0V89_001562 [Didymosphaeria variabile]KAJ4360993.1 hypothetical protein N0V89_001562 [Didymosphaeria variabile]